MLPPFKPKTLSGTDLVTLAQYGAYVFGDCGAYRPNDDSLSARLWPRLRAPTNQPPSKMISREISFRAYTHLPAEGRPVGHRIEPAATASIRLRYLGAQNSKDEAQRPLEYSSIKLVL